MRPAGAATNLAFTHCRVQRDAYIVKHLLITLLLASPVAAQSIDPVAWPAFLCIALHGY